MTKGAHGGSGLGYQSTATGKLQGRQDDSSQTAMTEAEQRAATKKEIIEAFEIQNTQNNRSSGSGQPAKKNKPLLSS